MIKGIIFDFDNTLMDFMKMKKRAVEAAADAMIDAGLTLSKEKICEEIFKVYWREGIEDQHVFDKLLLEKFGFIDYKILAAGILGYRKAKEASLVVYPHTNFVLTTLIRLGKKLAVVSDAPRLPVWMRIISLGLANFFDHVITFDDTSEKKPSPKPFLLALQKLNLEPHEVIMVGDWVERDIVGAKKLGIKTVFAKYGCESTTHLSKAAEENADYKIDDIIELIDIVKK